jgi:elongation factor Ts
MKITAKEIQQLREKTNAGVMDCKIALEQAKGDFEKAKQALRQKGLSIAAKKSSREAREGRIEAYVHLHNKIGVLVELNCETDFVAKCAEFKVLSKDLAMQIAALNPLYLKKEDVPRDVVKEQKGKIEDFYKTHCLLEQAFVKDQAVTIKDYLTEIIAKVGENIVLRRFVRFQLGEPSR